MMETSQIPQTLLLLSFLLLLWFFLFPYRKHRVDICRNRLFEIRNTLFIAAADGPLKFEDEAYVIVRRTINGMIRFAHEINLIQVITSYFVYRYSFKREAVQNYERALDAALKNLSTEAKHAVLEAIANAHFAILVQLFYTSIVLFVIFQPVIFILRIIKKLKGVLRKHLRGEKNKHPWRILDTLANQIGCL